MKKIGKKKPKQITENISVKMQTIFRTPNSEIELTHTYENGIESLDIEINDLDYLVGLGSHPISVGYSTSLPTTVRGRETNFRKEIMELYRLKRFRNNPVYASEFIEPIWNIIHELSLDDGEGGIEDDF